MKSLKALLPIAAMAVCAGLATTALASDYPSKPIKVLIGYTPGSSTDIVGRLVTQTLGEALKQPLVVENRPGAAGNIAADAAAKSAPDGYSLLFAQNGLAISVALNKALPFNGATDLIPIAGVAATPHILVVNPSSAYKSVSELVAAIKKEPGKLTFASSGVGNSDHMAGEMFKALAGLDAIHVPYKGGNPAANDVIGGQIDYYFAGMPVGLPFYKANRLRALAVTGRDKFPGAPELPTMQESGLRDYEMTLWQGFFVPANTPKAIIDQLTAAVLKAMADPGLRDRMTKAGVQLAPMNRAEFEKLYQSDIERWKKISTVANIKLN